MAQVGRNVLSAALEAGDLVSLRIALEASAGEIEGTERSAAEAELARLTAVTEKYPAPERDSFAVYMEEELAHEVKADATGRLFVKSMASSMS
jgi:hypothetical protein